MKNLEIMLRALPRSRLNAGRRRRGDLGFLGGDLAPGDGTLDIADHHAVVGGKPISDLAQIAEELRCAELGKDARGRLVWAVKKCAIPVSGTLGFKKAEVTAGGITLAEVDSRTMQSKLVPGLFLAEVWDDADNHPLAPATRTAAGGLGF
jgi:hypothetical protein